MTNYSFISSGLLVLLVFLVYYFARPRIPIRMNRTFFWLLIIEMVTIVIDIIDSEAKAHYDGLPDKEIAYVLEVVFCLLFLVRNYGFFVLTADILRVRMRENKLLKWLSRVVYLVTSFAVLTNSITSSVFSFDITGYHDGGQHYIIYLCSFFYIALSLSFIVIWSSRISRIQLVAAVSFNVVLLAGNVIRILLPGYFVMNLFCMIALIIVYLSFENPDFYMSDRGMAFNQKAFRDMMDELISKRSYRVLGFVLRGYVEQRGIYGGAQMDHGISLINEYLTKTYPSKYVFYLRNGSFAIVGSGSMDWNELRREISDRFRKPWSAFDADLYLDIGFVQVGWESGIQDADRLVNDMIIAFERAQLIDDPLNNYVDLDVERDIGQQAEIKRCVDRAIERNEVEVFLQPIVDSNTGALVAAEALARIRDFNGDLLSPTVFIPIAEKHGRINAMGELVLERTCRFISEHDMESLGLSWINVNLSPIQCMKRDLYERFTSILEKYHVDPRYVHLELTEQSISDYSTLEAQVNALHSSGFEFVLDDYGTGYSNLTRVRHYPFINIKLDMEVVQDYFKDRDAMIPTIVEAFKRMDYSITAEGIESKDMVDALTGIGCDYLQGYYFSRPLPMDEFLRKYSK